MTDEQMAEIIVEAWEEAGLLTDREAGAYTKLVQAKRLADVAAKAIGSTARLAGVYGDSREESRRLRGYH